MSTFPLHKIDKTLYSHTRNRKREPFYLEKHIYEVAELCYKMGSIRMLGAVCKLIGLFHDVGKFGVAFNTYITQCDIAKITGSPMPHSHVRHACTGANWLYQILKEKTKNLDFIESDFFIVVATVVYGHHTRLSDKQVLISKMEVDRLGSQHKEDMDSINRAKKSFLYEDIEKLIAEAQEEVAQLKRDSFSVELITRLCAGILAFADRKSASEHENTFKRDIRIASRVQEPKEIFINWLDNLERHRATLPSHNITVKEVRDRIYEKSRQIALTCSNEERIFFLDAPTGGGKTFAEFALSLNLAIRFGHERIFVTSPTRVVTDQMMEQAEIAFDNHGRKHMVLNHSSAEAKNIEEIFNCEDFQEAQFISMTVSQLLEHILFSNRPGNLLRLPQLMNSIICIDEVHELPFIYLKSIIHMIRQLAEEYNVRFILVSATSPDWRSQFDHFTGIPEAVSVLGDETNRLHQDMRRVTYNYNPQPKTWSDLGNDIIDRGITSLISVNTRKEAWAMYRELQSRRGVDVVYITSALTTEHRSIVIAKIKARLEDEWEARKTFRDSKPFYVVTTSVLDVGVDLDFPNSYSEMAPMDKIIQRAGRNNRSGRLDIADANVYIFEPAQKIFSHETEFGKFTDLFSAMLIKNGVDILYSPYWYKEFYKEKIQRHGGSMDDRHIEHSRERYDFEAVNDSFNMIEEDTATILVDFNRDAFDDLLDKITKAAAEKDYKLLRKLYRIMQKHAVSIPPGKTNCIVGLDVIPNTEVYYVRGQYDPVTGLGYLWS